MMDREMLDFEFVIPHPKPRGSDGLAVTHPIRAVSRLAKVVGVIAQQSIPCREAAPPAVFPTRQSSRSGSPNAAFPVHENRRELFLVVRARRLLPQKRKGLSCSHAAKQSDAGPDPNILVGIHTQRRDAGARQAVGECPQRASPGIQGIQGGTAGNPQRAVTIAFQSADLGEA